MGAEFLRCCYGDCGHENRKRNIFLTSPRASRKRNPRYLYLCKQRNQGCGAGFRFFSATQAPCTTSKTTDQEACPCCIGCTKLDTWDHMFTCKLERYRSRNYMLRYTRAASKKRTGIYQNPSQVCRNSQPEAGHYSEILFDPGTQPRKLIAGISSRESFVYN